MLRWKEGGEESVKARVGEADSVTVAPPVPSQSLAGPEGQHSCEAVTVSVLVYRLLEALINFIHENVTL